MVTIAVVLFDTAIVAAVPPTLQVVPPTTRPVPVIVVFELGVPEVTDKLLIVGTTTGALTVNATEPEVPPDVVTVIVFAPAASDGIVIVAEVVEDTEMVAAVPLTLQVVPPTTKFVPVKVTEEPAKPLVGETPESVGAGWLTVT